jgi:hypothetical protein
MKMQPVSSRATTSPSTQRIRLACASHARAMVRERVLSFGGLTEVTGLPGGGTLAAVKDIAASGPERDSLLRPAWRRRQSFSWYPRQQNLCTRPYQTVSIRSCA